MNSEPTHREYFLNLRLQPLQGQLVIMPETILQISYECQHNKMSSMANLIEQYQTVSRTETPLGGVQLQTHLCIKHHKPEYVRNLKQWQKRAQPKPVPQTVMGWSNTMSNIPNRFIYIHAWSTCEVLWYSNMKIALSLKHKLGFRFWQLQNQRLTLG